MNEFAEPLHRLLAHASTPHAVRAVESGGSPAAMWDAFEASGFLEALLPEEQGGAGLSLRDAFELLVAEGHHACPVPLGITMVARALIVEAGGKPPRGPVAIAAHAIESGLGGIACVGTPHGLVAQWVVVPLAGRWVVLPAASATRTASGIHASLRADLRWAGTADAAFESDAPLAWKELAAVITAAQAAGAMQRALELTLEFANQRVQFGRSIGKFQAIQHQLAVMAEQVAAARMAAQIGCYSERIQPNPLRAALAKARVSEAAAYVAPMAHAIHGAIGITAELDLQLFTRRLHEARSDYGSESFWNRVLGHALVGSGAPALDFMRGALLPT